MKVGAKVLFRWGGKVVHEIVHGPYKVKTDNQNEDVYRIRNTETGEEHKVWVSDIEELP